MRGKVQKIAREGDKRIVRRFLVLPMCLEHSNDAKQWRWLEWADIEQVYEPVDMSTAFWVSRKWFEGVRMKKRNQLVSAGRHFEERCQ